jgi:hypothetical protein
MASMARLMRFATFMAFIFSVGSAFAAGGTCPSGANYINPSNPTGPMVTLSSLGVMKCYFIAAIGADTNTGTTEGSPWLHAPGMPNCSGNCATVTPAAGEGFIFRGGDTWHFGNSGVSPYTGGTWSFAYSGGSGSPIYIGVDQSWYTGGSWARPILTWDNAPCGSATVGGNCNSTTGQYHVTSCTYPSSQLFNDQSQSWVTVDNFEATGMCQSGSSTVDHFRYGSATNIAFVNNYIHGWSHMAWSCSGDAGTCTNISIFRGGPSPGTTPGETLTFNVVDGSDSDPAGAELGKGSFWTVDYNVFRYVSQLVVANDHVFHDNLMEHWYCPGDQNDHPNLLEENSEYTGGAKVNAIYDNVFRNIASDVNSCLIGSIVGMWPAPQVGLTEYVFNNLTYSEYDAEVLNIGNNGASIGTLNVFNNTWEDSSNTAIYNCQNTSATVTLANEHAITDNSNQYACTTGWNPTKVTNLLMTHATATTDGYKASQACAYSPTLYASSTPSANSPTVGNGTNEKTNFCNALSSSSDTLIQAAGAACNAGATYACSYNSSNHTVICPAPIPTPISKPRPASIAWDQGAYQTNGSAPNPPTNPVATVP